MSKGIEIMQPEHTNISTLSESEWVGYGCSVASIRMRVQVSGLHQTCRIPIAPVVPSTCRVDHLPLGDMREGIPVVRRYQESYSYHQCRSATSYHVLLATRSRE